MRPGMLWLSEWYDCDLPNNVLEVLHFADVEQEATKESMLFV